LTLVAGVQEYEIPDFIFEDRIQKLELYINGNVVGGVIGYEEIMRISYRDITRYESNQRNPTPQYYAIIGRKIRFVNIPTGTYTVRMWYIRNPEKLVLPQGRISSLNVASQYAILDGIGDSLSTEADQLDSYINIIDGQNGNIKASLQLQNVTDNKVKFRTVPLRTTVLGVRTILPGLPEDTTVTEDDYVCSVEGTCVPYFSKPVVNFLIQYTVAEMTRKVGGPGEEAEAVIAKFEKQLEKSWTGREMTLRIKKKSSTWRSPTLRWWK
jgi:hypothetical protein